MEQFPSVTIPSSHPSPQDYASLDHLLNVSKLSSKAPTPLTGQQVMVPCTTKAFFQGSLAPTTSSTLSENDPTTNNLMNRERVLMNVGQNFMVEMTRDNACDFIHRRCASINSATTVAACGSNKEEDGQHGKLVIKKGFLNRKKHSKKQNNRKKNDIRAEGVKMDRINQESRPDFSSASPSDHKAHLLQTEQQQEQKDQQQDMKRKDQTTAETSQVLPYFDIREEYDENGNEIKAEVLNVSAELKKLQEVLKNNDQDEVDTTERTANVTTSKENLKERREVIQTLSSNLGVPQEQMQQVAGNSNTDDSSRKIEEYPVDMKSSCASKKEIDYNKISARLKELAKLEEQDELNNSMNSKSAKSLQGKGWAKGFFNEKNRRSSRKQKAKPIIGTSKATNDCESVKDESKVPEEMDMEGAKKKGSRRVKFSGSDQIKEIPRVGTATAHGSLSNTSDHDFIGDRGMSETVLQRPNAHKSRNSKKVLSVGSVMERSVDSSRQSSSAISNSRRGDTRQQTSNATHKPLSRFAQQRLNKYSG